MPKAKKAKRRYKKMMRRAEKAAARKAIGDQIKALDEVRGKVIPLVEDIKSLVPIGNAGELGTACIHAVIATRQMLDYIRDRLCKQKLLLDGKA